MSLNYTGYSVTLEINFEGHKKKFYGFSEPTGDDVEDTKIAHRKAMEQFMESEYFKPMTGQLMDMYNIEIITMVHTGA